MPSRPPLLLLETPRLRLRIMEESDLEPLVAYRQDPEVARYQSWTPDFSMDLALALLRDVRGVPPGTPGVWLQLAIETQDGDIAGDIGFRRLEHDPRQAEIGFTLARRFQKQGYATEAGQRMLQYLFIDWELHRVRAVCDAQNLASARVLERLGMRREAHIVEGAWFKGEWGSEYWYAILRREWLAGKSSGSET